MSKSPLKKIKKIALGYLEEFERCRKVLVAWPAEARAVHKMRVSVRRLRELLFLLRDAVNRDKVDRLTERLREIMKTLGNCRSLDVSLEVLRKEFSKSHAPAARFTAKELHEERRLLKSGLLRELSYFERKAFSAVK